jgi:hypothetical protein
MREFIIREWKKGSGEPSGKGKPKRAEGGETSSRSRRASRETTVESPRRRAEPAPEEAAPLPELRAEGLESQIRVAHIPVKRASGSTGSKPAAPALTQAPAQSPGDPAKPRKKGERSFIIAYDGVFVGFFEAEGEVTPREAFLRVAQELASEEGFEAEKLELYKPVLIRNAKPAKAIHVVRGKLAKLWWQARGTGVVQQTASRGGAAEPAPGTTALGTAATADEGGEEDPSS